MTASRWSRRFFESTRGRVLASLRRADRTVDELARELDLTDNAVRNHLSALERDGLIRQAGQRRGIGAGKPAAIYTLHTDAESLLSRAYSPVLAAVVEALTDELPDDRSEVVLREAGVRLARQLGGRASGDSAARARAAASVLESLGGDTEIAGSEGVTRIRGARCPLSAVVRHRPEMCAAVAALVGEIAGAEARVCCEHGERPRCCFDLAVPA